VPQETHESSYRLVITERETGYDLLRVWAIVAVVSIHVLMVYRVPGAPVSAVSLLDDLLHFAVPVFFFVSGALVWGGYRGSSAAHYAGFLQRRAITVAAPYLAWSALYLTIAGIRGNWVYWVAHTPLLLFTGRSWYHLYFVPVLLLFYLLTPLAAPLARRWPELFVLGAYAAVLTLSGPVTALASRVGGPMLVTFAAASVTHFSHMALGAWFAHRKRYALPRLQLIWPILVVTGVMFSLVTSTRYLPAISRGPLAIVVTQAVMGLLVLGLAGLAFRIRLGESARPRVATAAAYSYGVYLVHPALLLAWRSAITTLGGSGWWDWPWFAVLSLFAITGLSLAIISLLAARTSTAWVVGLGALRRAIPNPDVSPELDAYPAEL